MIRSINDEWIEFRQLVYPGAPDAIMKEAQMLFFSGHMAALRALSRLCEMNPHDRNLAVWKLAEENRVFALEYVDQTSNKGPLQ
jgi:hypothetical protein